MEYTDICNYFKNEINTNDLEEKKKLCNDIYRYNQNNHPEWEEMFFSLESKFALLNDITEHLDSPIKEFLRIYTVVYRPGFSVGINRGLSDELYDDILNCTDISDEDKYIIMASRLENIFSNGDYYGSEEIAEELFETDDLPPEVIINLMRYYKNTRRYDVCDCLYEKYNNSILDEEYNDAKDRQSGRKKEYKPGKKDKIDAYSQFMKECLDNDINPVSARKKSHGDRMEDDEYPDFEYVTNMDFDSFVAYDVETSGLSSKFDYITEIGAIKVADGKVVDSEQFRFQELIHPYGRPKRLSREVIELTGITQDMVNEARSVEEVFNDFADFIGDNILVGYNNEQFDGKFLRRAGRYAKRIINNKQFDLLPVTYLYCDTDDNKLNTVAASYGIENPRAHRAYADAITTARLYLKIKEAKEK